MPPRRASRQQGFTLIEVLVALALLGLIYALVGPRVIDLLSRGNQRAASFQIENFKTTLDLFRLDVGRYPTEREGLAALVENPGGLQRWAGPYLSENRVPDDPWGRAYVYRVPGPDGLAYGILSLGADGTEGGEGENQDVTSW